MPNVLINSGRDAIQFHASYTMWLKDLRDRGMFHLIMLL